MNRLLTLLLAAAFTAAALMSQTLAQTCVTPPSCENLGYNKTAAMCAGLDILRCPFDDTKVFCSKKYMAQIAIGDILFSDMTTSSNPVTGKTPIGIVFDSNQKLALALTTKGPYRIYWGVDHRKIFHFTPASSSGHILTNGLPISFTLSLPFDEFTATEDGKKNTETLALLISNFREKETAKLDTFIGPLSSAIKNGLDTYLDEVQRGCYSCSEDEIQREADKLQQRDLDILRSSYFSALNTIEEMDRNTDNPYAEILEYYTTGTNGGDWFIPSQSELNRIGTHFNLVLNSYNKLHISFRYPDDLKFASSTISGPQVSGISLSPTCNTTYYKQERCSYESGGFSFLQGYGFMYFPVINF